MERERGGGGGVSGGEVGGGDREQRDFQGQFHSVERASRGRPPAATPRPSRNESEPLSSPGLKRGLNKKHNQTPGLKSLMHILPIFLPAPVKKNMAEAPGVIPAPGRVCVCMVGRLF